MQVGASVAGGAAAAVSAAGSAAVASIGPDGGSRSYFVDPLFRRETNAPATSEPAAAAPNAETARILLNSLRCGALPADDTRYLGQLVAQRTGLSQPDAEKRVSETCARMQAKLQDAETAARDAANKARKAAMRSMLLFFSAFPSRSSS